MRRCSILLFWFFAVFSAVFGQGRSPSVVFESISTDLGRITQGEVARHVFSFSNKGAGTLEIKGIETS